MNTLTKTEERWHKLRAWQKTLDAMVKQLDTDIIPLVSDDAAFKLHLASNALFMANSSLNAGANLIARES